MNQTSVNETAVNETAVNETAVNEPSATEAGANEASAIETSANEVSRYDLNACFAPDGASAQPKLLFKKPGLTTLYLNVPPGQGMPVHDHVGCQVTLIGMVGEASVVVSGVPHPLRAGELLTFAGELKVEPRNDSAEPCAVLISLVEVPG